MFCIVTLHSHHHWHYLWIYLYWCSQHWQFQEGHVENDVNELEHLDVLRFVLLAWAQSEIGKGTSLAWHICRTKLAQKVPWSYEFSYKNAPNFSLFYPLFCGPANLTSSLNCLPVELLTKAFMNWVHPPTSVKECFSSLSSSEVSGARLGNFRGKLWLPFAPKFHSQRKSPRNLKFREILWSPELSAPRSQWYSCECECEFWRAQKIGQRILAVKSQRKSFEWSEGTR